MTDTRVVVLVVTSSDHVVEDRGRVDVVIPDRPLTICVRPPEEWTAPAPARPRGDLTCRLSVDPVGVDPDGWIELVVTPPEGSP